MLNVKKTFATLNKILKNMTLNKHGKEILQKMPIEELAIVQTLYKSQSPINCDTSLPELQNLYKKRVICIMAPTIKIGNTEFAGYILSPWIRKVIDNNSELIPCGSNDISYSEIQLMEMRFVDNSDVENNDDVNTKLINHKNRINNMAIFITIKFITFMFFLSVAFTALATSMTFFYMPFHYKLDKPFYLILPIVAILLIIISFAFLISSLNISSINTKEDLYGLSTFAMTVVTIIISIKPLVIELINKIA